VIKKSLSVRQTEELVKRMSKPQAVKANTEIPEIKDLEDKLISELGAKVKILHKGKKANSRYLQLP